MAPTYLPAMLPASILSLTSRTTTTTTIPHLLYALTTASHHTTPTRPQRRNATSTTKPTRTASRKLPSLPPRSPSASKLGADPSSSPSSPSSTSSTTTTTSRPLKPYLWAISLFGATTGLYLSYYISSLLLATSSPASSLPQTTSISPSSSSSSSNELDIDITTRWADPTRDYDEEIEFSERAMFMGRKRRRLLSENVVEGKVLEVSCGTGRNFEWYDFESSELVNEDKKGKRKKRGIESLTFNDQSEIMLKKARAKWEGLQADRLRSSTARGKGGTAGLFTGPVKGIVGDAGVRGVIPRPEGGFDTIVQTMGVCSMRDPVAFLREMRFLVRQPGERVGGTDGTEGMGPEGTSGKVGEEAEEEEDRGGRILLLEHGRGHYDWINRLLDRGAVGHAKRYGCWFNKDVGSVVAESGLVVERVRRYHLGTTWEVVLRPGKGEGGNEKGGGGGREEIKMVEENRGKESGNGGDGGGDGNAWWRWW